MKVLSYRITLHEPLLATRLAGDPNSAISYGFVPGSLVRGALVAAYLAEKDPKKLDAGEEESQRLFFDGRTCYLNAYPAYEPVGGRARRMLPIPLSWYAPKDREDNQVYDFALEVRHEIEGDNVQFKAIHDGGRQFCYLEDDQAWLRRDMARRLSVHTQRNRIKGRAMPQERRDGAAEGEGDDLRQEESGGAVFQYDALGPGEQFIGLILVQNDTDAGLLGRLLGRVSALGGSHNSGYGRVGVAVEPGLEPHASAPVFEREVPGKAAEIPAGEPFVVTLLSDAILRDPDTGQGSVNLAVALGKLWDAKVSMVEAAKASDGVEQRSVYRLAPVGGFNRTWGLPLPQAQALSAGSTFVLRSDRRLLSKDIEWVETYGLGGRRAEGFGRLAVNWQQHAEITTEDYRPAGQGEDRRTLSGAAEETARLMVNRLLERELDIALRAFVNRHRIKDAPARAQLGRLRLVTRETLAELDERAAAEPFKGASRSELVPAPSESVDETRPEALQRLKDALESIRKRRQVRDQFESARLDGQRLSYWLEARLANPGEVWQLLGKTGLERRLGANVRRGVKDDALLAQRYTVRLIDAILARAAQEERPGEEGER